MIRNFYNNLRSAMALATFVVATTSIISALFLIAPQNVKADVGNIFGEIYFRDDVQLPEHAVLLVQVADVTDTNGAIKIIDEQAIDPDNTNPIAFKLEIDPKAILANHQYALQARIAVGDALWFVSDKRVPLENTKESTPYMIHHVKVNQTNGAFSESTPELVGQKWRVQELKGQTLTPHSKITMIIDNKPNVSEINVNKPNVADQDKVTQFDVSGSAGCNQYSSKVAINRDSKTVEFDAPGMTYLACSSDVDQVENAFIEALMQARSYEFDDVGRLFFKDDHNNYSLIFVPEL